MIRALVLLIGLAMMFLATACGDSREQQGYLGRYPNEMIFIQWTESSSGNLSGNVRVLYPGPGESFQLEDESQGFTGIRDGAKVSLSFQKGLPFPSNYVSSPTTLTGSLKGDTLTLAVPNKSGTFNMIVLHAASVGDYDNAVSELKQKVEKGKKQYLQNREKQITQNKEAQQKAANIAAQQGAVEKADKELGEALGELGSSTDNLNRHTTAVVNELSTYVKHWDTMQNNYKKLQRATSIQPPDCYQVQVANSVSYDLQVIQTDRKSLNYWKDRLTKDVTPMDKSQASLFNSYTSDVSEVKKDIKTVQDALGNLQAATSANVTDKPKPQFGPTNVGTAISKAQEQIAITEAILNDVSSKSDMIVQRAQQLQQSANNLTAKTNCS